MSNDNKLFNDAIRAREANRAREDKISKAAVISILNKHLEQIKEARKDTAGLGMLQFVIKMILREGEGL